MSQVTYAIYAMFARADIAQIAYGTCDIAAPRG